MGIELNIRYRLGHTYQETWAKESCYCPGCGKQEVWAEQGEGDYYVGNQYLCSACGSTFYMPGGCVVATDQGGETIFEQRLAGIRGIP